jgi:hypothetical protein
MQADVTCCDTSRATRVDPPFDSRSPSLSLDLR